MILIGGATGVGKSTIATQLAARLGIVRFVATRRDPRGHAVDVLAGADAHAPHVVVRGRRGAPRAADAGRPIRSIVGFREQTAAVAVGINALIERAALEGTSIVIEGAHVVPGFFDLDAFAGRILAVPFVIAVDDEERHRSHFGAREDAVASRPAQRYATGFDEHPPAAALREEPGAVARRAGDPQLRLRPVDRRGDRPGDGTSDRARGGADAVAVTAAATATARRGRDSEQSQREGRRKEGRRMRLFLDTASIEEIREINRWGVLSRA